MISERVRSLGRKIKELIVLPVYSNLPSGKFLDIISFLAHLLDTSSFNR